MKSSLYENFSYIHTLIMRVHLIKEQTIDNFVRDHARSKSRVHLSICWIGTHAEYTHLCKRGQQYSIYIY
jgi:hypothetical protein